MRGDVAVHGIDALEDDELGPVAGGAQQLLEMGEVVVAEDRLLAAGLAHALDHRVVVEGVRQDQAVRDQPRDGRDAGLVRDVARGEDEGGLLAVQVGELRLELDHADGSCRRCCGCRRHPVPSAPGGLDHGAGHVRVLAHAEIVVRAPDRDRRGVRRARARAHWGSGRRCARYRRRRGSGARVLEALEGRREKVLVIHHLTGYGNGPL